MPRIRSIKPELWSDEALGGVPIGARLLYVGLITQSDDHGRFRAAPALVRGAVFPYDESLSVRRIAEWLDALAESHLVTLYTVKGERYGCFPTWSKHQRIDNAGAPLYPSVEDADSLSNPRSEAEPGALAETRGEPPRTAAGTGNRDQGTGIKEHDNAREDFDTAFACWNAQDALVHHQRSRSDMRKAYKAALGDWTPSEILEAINLYGTVLLSEKHYFSYRWTFAEFLLRGVGKFAAEAQPLTRYFGADPKTNGNGEAKRASPAELMKADIERCKREYRVLVEDGMAPADARLEVSGVFNDEVVKEAVPA